MIVEENEILLSTLLCATVEMVDAQSKLITLLSEFLHIPTAELRSGKLQRLFVQVGIIEGTPWKYFFHGFGCDFEHIYNNRRLIYRFGPKGRLDICGQDSVVLYITESIEHDGKYLLMKNLIQDYDLQSKKQRYSILLSQLEPFYAKMVERNWIEVADLELAELYKRSIHDKELTIGFSLQEHLDMSLAWKLALSKLGREVASKICN